MLLLYLLSNVEFSTCNLKIPAKKFRSHTNEFNDIITYLFFRGMSKIEIIHLTCVVPTYLATYLHDENLKLLLNSPRVINENFSKRIHSFGYI